MTKSREVAVNTLFQVFENKAYSNIALNRNLKESNLEEKDRALVTELVYGTIKYKYTIDKILLKFLDKNFNKVDKYVLNLLRVSVYQLKYLDKIPDFAVVNEAVNLTKERVSKGASGLVNGVLRNYIRNKDQAFYNSENVFEKLAFMYSYPQWIIKLMVNQYGEDVAVRILQGLNSRPSVTVRVNSLKVSYDEALERLQAKGYDAEEGEVAAEAVRINKGSSIEANDLFRDGFITVQDESAMLVAPSMDLEKDLIVMDLCSAPGGKTTHIAELMDNTGSVKAFDIYEHKLQLIEENVKRLGITNVETAILDAESHEEKYVMSADRVLIDVPCSGLGIIRKKPEIKYTKKEKELKDIVVIQRRILENAATYVKPGGILMYSTCTVNKSENEDNVDWFLKNHSEYESEKIYFGSRDNLLYNEKGYLTVLPDKYMDGFFIAKLRRKQ